MAIEIKIPQVGESVQEALLAEWFKADGDAVERDEPILVIETDKVTLEVVAETDGVLEITVPAGETVAIGAVVGTIDTAAAPQPGKAPAEEAPQPAVAQSAPAAAPAPTAPAPQPVAAPAPEPGQETVLKPVMPPSVRRLVAEHDLDPAVIKAGGPGGRLTKSDVLLHLEQMPKGPAPVAPAVAPSDTAAPETVRRVPMSPIRRRIAQHLVAAKQNTAMLTTFNEIDMGRVMGVRSEYKERFKKKHGVGLGFMSFFIKACVDALIQFPEINAFVEGDGVIYHDYQHVGVAIGSGRGLVVPVIRNAQNLSFAQIEQTIIGFVNKVADQKLELADLEGGTFTVSNGGVYGSLLSTPILNMPQSGILGMHKIEKRPVVIDDEVVIRPMMYVALSYDHRIVDGREAVSFLKRIKACVENPERIMMDV